MPLLVEFTSGSTLYRLSSEGVPLDHYWENKIISLTPPQFSITYDHGGKFTGNFGSIGIAPDFFSDNGIWPPDKIVELSLYFTESDEASRQTVYKGYGYINRLNRTEILYDLWGESEVEDEKIASGSTYNDSLVNVFSSAATTLGLTLDSSLADSSSSPPQIAYTLDKERSLLELLTEFAAFHSHFFYIAGSTLYLVDMLSDNGSRTITEFDFFPSNYQYKPPTWTAFTNTNSEFETNVDYGKVHQQVAYDDSSSQIAEALQKIITVRNKPRCNLKMPITGTLPKPGEKVSWTDEAFPQTINAYIRVRNLRYDFLKDELRVSGEGDITA